jgi:hypothetical protein
MVQKIRAVRARLEDLPAELQGKVKGGLPGYLVIGIAQSGARALDELAVGRALLADKIYRHQKVRAVESMVAALVHQIGRLLEPSPIVLPYLLTDEQLLHLDEGAISRLLSKKISDQEKGRIRVALDLIGRLRDRRLFVRAFAFAQRMPLDPYAKDPDQHIGIAALIVEARARKPRGALVRRIAKEVDTMLGLLDKGDIVKHLPTSDLYEYIWLDPPAEEAEIPAASRALLIDDEQGLMRFAEPYGETTGWADAYLLTRDLGYVFTVPELAPFVYLAAERIVRLEYQVRVPSSMIGSSKQDKEVIEGLRRDLSDKGYYAGVPYDLRPEPFRLTRGDVPAVLRDVTRAVSGYNPPMDTPDGEPLRVDERRIRDWIRQFDDTSFVEPAMVMLRQLRLIGRRETGAAVHRYMTDHLEFNGASLTALGSPRDSSAINVYWAHDAATAFGLRGRYLDAAITEDRPIVFIDDFIGTGWQASSIVANWFGQAPPVDLKEERSEELAVKLQELFRAKERIVFLFVSGMEAGADFLRKTIAQVGLNATVHIDTPANALPRAFGTGLYSSPAIEETFKKRCHQIGLELLLEPARGHDKDWAEARALGYGNDAFLVLFPNNTPTATLTCLWKAGKVEGIPWMPLFPRRAKQ